MNIIFQFKQKHFHAGGLKMRAISQKLRFSFRRKAQVRSNSLFIFIKSVPCKGDTTRGKRKLKQGQKTAFPFPLMVSPLRTSSLNPYSLPFFTPLHFACRRRPNPIHLFVLFSIAMFTGWGFTPFFYLHFFGYLVSKFIKVFSTLNYQLLKMILSICCLFCLPLRRTTSRLLLFAQIILYAKRLLHLQLHRATALFYALLY